MRKRSRIQSLSLCVGGLALTGLAGQGLAQMAVTGNFSTTPVNYGANTPGTGALSTQTINTSFGDSTYPVANGPDANGSELDAAYGVVQNGNLDLFFTGNMESNGNHIVVFIDDGAMSGGSPTGQNVVNISGGWTAAGMNTSTFSPGFYADLLLDANDYHPNGQMYVDQYKLTTSGSTNSYLGSVSAPMGIGHGTLGGIGFGLNNSNTAGVIGDANGGAASASAAQAVGTGLEISIPMSALGNPTNIKVLAAVEGNNDGFASNQFLPGLPAGTISIGNVATSTPPGPGPYSVAGMQGAFNFSTLANEYFAVPTGGVANGTWLNPVAGFSWGTAANWSNSYIPNVSGDAANFAGASTTQTVTLDGAHTVGSMSFTSTTNPYTIAAGSGGVLTLQDPSGTATINNYDGSNTISAPVVLNSNAAITVINSTDTASISGNISGTGGLSVNNPGNGYLLVSGTNTYSGGTSVIEGNLKLGSSTALPTGTALTLSAQDLPAGVLNLNGNNATVSSITILTGPKTAGTGATAQINNTSAVSATSTFTYAGSNANPSTTNNCNVTDNNLSGGGTTALAVTSGMLTLGGNDTYGGGNTVSAGATLQFGITSTAAPTGLTYPSGANTVNNGTLILNDTVSAGAISGSGTTTVTAGQTVNVTTLNQGGAVDNEGNLTVLSGGTVGKITETGTAGALAIYGGSLQLAQGGGASSQSVLYIAAGNLDITNNHMFINYGTGADPISTIVGYIQSGAYNGGTTITWTGGGIISSNAQTNSNYGIGYADSADPGNPAGLASNQIEIAYTLLGDANLDYKVNGTDFNLMATNFNQAVTNGWDLGDFNYDGKVNGSDFVLLANNFNQFASQSAVSAGDIAALDAFAAANGISLTSVPEPASMGLLALGVIGGLARRRRTERKRCQAER